MGVAVQLGTADGFNDAPRAASLIRINDPQGVFQAGVSGCGWNKHLGHERGH